ncbi:MAG TPA: hypothetical protein VLL52_06420 [Anaerolineae bacterium]|nr:hypothetical protein [Anaerolineae bacterium]
MSVQEAIRIYHDLLNNRLARVSTEQLEEQLGKRGLYFGDRPLCTVLRPRFMDQRQYRLLQERIRVLMRAFNRAYRLAMADKPFRDQFGLEEWEEDLIQHDPGFYNPVPVSRLDAFFLTDSDELWFTEYNAEVPAASAYNDVLSEVFYGLPVMRKFMRRYNLRPLMSRHTVLQTLMETYYNWMPRNEPPRIAILDWNDVPTFSEFVLFDQFFKSHGFPCKIVDPREVEYKDGKLMSGDFHITLIYKRVLISELYSRGGRDHPVLQAVRDGAVCMINPVQCKILYKKCSLAVLSDDRNRHIFTQDERQAIAQHIPWTRRVEERHSDYNDTPVDLIPFILKYRERFVLKPNDDYGGRGIVLGWNVDDATWEKAVYTAMQSPHVVQERVVIPTEPYPSLVDGRVQISDRQLDTAPFVFYGEYVDGCLTRLSTDTLINVTAGGGSTVPTFILEPR